MPHHRTPYGYDPASLSQDYVTVPDLADFAGVSVETVRRAIRELRLPVYKRPGLAQQWAKKSDWDRLMQAAKRHGTTVKPYQTN